MSGTATLSRSQQEFLFAAKAWWQEGERALDYLAEKSRQDLLLHRLRSPLEALRLAPIPTADLVTPLLPLARLLTANRVLNRTLVTDAFASALRQLLFGDASLPERLHTFLQTENIGPQSASQWLYLAFPERFPTVTPTGRRLLAPPPAQRGELRARVLEPYSLTPESISREALALLTDFALYEEARDLLQLHDFTELNAILQHSQEMPRPEKRRRQRKRTGAEIRVREPEAAYQADVPASGLQAAPTEPELLRYLEGYIAAQGFIFPPLTIRNYYLALKAKPFVLLTGLSGTGKTRLTRLLADALTGGAAGQYLLLPVRPDWTDGTPLIGYYNLLTDRYISTPFLDLLRDATRPENRDRAYFTCLDEMNISSPNYYLSEILSVMETDDRRIVLHEGRSALLSPNVFLTGSMNIDEASHQISKKVLDRANTIEFTQVNLSQNVSASPISLPHIPPPQRQRLFLNNCVTSLQAARSRLAVVNPSYPDRVIALLSELNDILEKRSLHFGYRVRDEIMRYCAASFTTEGKGLLLEEPEANLQTALDFQINQKVLPRITGTTEALTRMLAEVEVWSVSREFPRTTAKLNRMRRRSDDDGFVTFYEL